MPTSAGRAPRRRRPRDRSRVGDHQGGEPVDTPSGELRRTPASGGPASTSTGAPFAGCSRIESPWPTSSTLTSRPGPARGSPPEAGADRHQERRGDHGGGDAQPTGGRRAGRSRAAAPASSADHQAEPAAERRVDAARAPAGPRRAARPAPSAGPRTTPRPGRCRRRAGPRARSPARPGTTAAGRAAAASIPSHITGASASTASRFAGSETTEKVPK